MIDAALRSGPAQPELHAIQNPVRLGWQPLVKIEHYHMSAEQILGDST
jgi:hypothetical protein